MNSPRIGIVGGGIGGLTLALALLRSGLDATVFEQARQFGRVGADVNLTPNAVRALDGLGLGEAIRASAARPTQRLSRRWDTGEITSRIEMSEAAETLYQAPQLTLHRADLLEALDSALPAGAIRFGKRVSGVASNGNSARLSFEDGSSAEFDILIGADGIHSIVRAAMFGQEHPRFTGVVAYRAIVPREKTNVPGLDAFTKWWGPDPRSQIVTFPLNHGREIFIFATTAQDDWRHESWTQPGSVDELRAAYAGFHSEARALLDACDSVLKTALYEREPLACWSKGAMTLLGDSCHPMMPFMAQGAAMAIEDAIVLARSLVQNEAKHPQEAFRRYEGARLDRTRAIQLGSRKNDWLREGGGADWVYGYDA
ncbi:MAG TPA: FAD-dependent monooxygenase, partial [Beijerinckiaceae bacterium]|nr:FAD-dependent monooxygenase [Beijerinckiaceae bacterium]